MGHIGPERVAGGRVSRRCFSARRTSPFVNMVHLLTGGFSFNKITMVDHVVTCSRGILKLISEEGHRNGEIPRENAGDSARSARSIKPASTASLTQQALAAVDENRLSEPIRSATWKISTMFFYDTLMNDSSSKQTLSLSSRPCYSNKDFWIQSYKWGIIC